MNSYVELRLECLRMAKDASLSNPDVGLWIKRARELEDFVLGAADKEPKPVTASNPPQKRRGRPPKNRTEDKPVAAPNGAHAI